MTDQNEDQVAAEEPAVQILTLKTTDGEIIAGDFIETTKAYGRDVHVLIVQGIQRWVPVNNCIWWAIGSVSTIEMRKRLHEEMREQARQYLLEAKQAAEAAVEESSEEQGAAEPALPLEEQVRLRDRVRDQNSPRMNDVVRSIAGHQRSLAKKVGPQIPDNRVIQPGETPVLPKTASKPQARSSISRLNDDSNGD